MLLYFDQETVHRFEAVLSVDRTTYWRTKPEDPVRAVLVLHNKVILGHCTGRFTVVGAGFHLGQRPVVPPEELFREWLWLHVYQAGWMNRVEAEASSDGTLSELLEGAPKRDNNEQ